MGQVRYFGPLFYGPQPFSDYCFYIICNHIMEEVPLVRRVPLVRLISQISPTRQKVHILSDNFYNWQHCSGFHFTGFHITYIIHISNNTERNSSKIKLNQSITIITIYYNPDALLLQYITSYSLLCQASSNSSSRSSCKER